MKKQKSMKRWFDDQKSSAKIKIKKHIIDSARSENDEEMRRIKNANKMPNRMDEQEKEKKWQKSLFSYTQTQQHIELKKEE